MTFPTFEALTQQLGQLFQEQRYAEALDLATHEGPRFPADRPWAVYWRMCAAARTGQPALTIRIAEQALAEGLWYGEVMWRQTPSFRALQGDPDFERLVAASRVAEAQAASSAAPVMLTRQPAQAAPPLLLALHGNQQTAAQTLPFWEPAVTQGWALAVPQSSQAMYTGAYAWDDLGRAFADVQAAYAQLPGKLDFDPQRVALAGHSLGGLVAIQMALTGALMTRGFVVIGPAVPFLDAPEALEAVLPQALARGLRGYFILGAEDEDIEGEAIHALAKKLQAAGLACAVETVPGAAHAYTPAYQAALARALDFLTAA